MAARLEEAFDDPDIELIESTGGVFEVTVDGRLVFSKKRTGRHADPDEVVRAIREAGLP